LPMPSPLPEPSGPSEHETQSTTERYAARVLALVALIYALLAGLHTLQDFDLGWQLATGRWVLQHRQIFSADVFSYTAHGAPWIYPVLSGIFFYLVYLVGGYGLLSWMGATACAGTIALLLRLPRADDNNNFARSVLALIAIPLIANRTQPRAEMFTTLLFAAFLSLLWRHYNDRESRSPLWLLPGLMVVWVNLHLGFISGLALCGTYVFLEMLELPFPKNRAAARVRLLRAWPWLVLTGLATFANPWGARIYAGLARQQQAQSLHSSWVVEWENIRPSWTSVRQALDWRDPQSSFWWLLAIAVVCAGMSLWHKRWGAAVLLLGSACFTIEHVRMQALFACVTVVLGGSLLQDAWKTRGSTSELRLPKSMPPRWRNASILLVAALLTVLAGIRSRDLVTDRYYLRSSQLSLFGTGLSWWFPERAVDFIQREKLPANIFNTYSLGGYLTWRLFPDDRDYIDSRALPFGSQLFFRAYELSVEPPDSRVWQQEADARGINSIIVPLGGYRGIAAFPQLQAFCRSQAWRPVYLDEVSTVFVRRTPQTTLLIDRLQIDCDKVSFALPTGPTPDSSRARAQLFNYWGNAAGILCSLGHYSEALAYLDAAQEIFADNANLRLTRALVLERSGRAAEAEEEFRISIKLEPQDESWFDLGLFYMTQKRYADAVDVFRRSAESSSRPHDMWMMLGQAYLQMGQPQPALASFDKAQASSPFREGGEALGARFDSLVATGRAKAWYQLGDLAQAVSFQEEAVKLAPEDAKLWLGLADLYDAQGRTAQAEQARSRAVPQKD